jgi:hypothetical protein
VLTVEVASLAYDWVMAPSDPADDVDQTDALHPLGEALARADALIIQANALLDEADRILDDADRRMRRISNLPADPQRFLN